MGRAFGASRCQKACSVAAPNGDDMEFAGVAGAAIACALSAPFKGERGAGRAAHLWSKSAGETPGEDRQGKCVS